MGIYAFYLNTVECPNNVHRCLLIAARRWRQRMLWQLNDATRHTLQFTHILSAFANNASNLQQRNQSVREKRARNDR